VAKILKLKARYGSSSQVGILLGYSCSVINAKGMQRKLWLERSRRKYRTSTAKERVLEIDKSRNK
jgi:hypothetical protein